MLFYLLLIIFLPEMVFSSEPQIIPWSIPSDLVQGGKVKLMCSVSKGSHPLKFDWLMNGHNIYETNDLFVQNLDDASILNIKNLQLIHNSNISCVATNRFGKDIYTSLLIVNAAPQWIKKPTENLNIKEGESIKLDCIANGFPNPKITWFKTSGSLIKNSKSDNLEQLLNQPVKSLSNGTLQLDFVTKSDEGEYICTVDNKISEKLVSKTQISIQTPVKVSMIDDNGKEFISLKANEVPVNYARKGESFSVRCVAVGDQPITINWFKSNELIRYKSSNMEILSSSTTSGLISELHFRSIERSDSGIYECVVKNNLGESKKNQKLMVLEPPESPKNVVISDLESNSVRINWKLGYNGNLDLTKINIYYWESKKKQTGNHKLNKVEIDLAASTWHVLKSLKSGTTYNIAVTSMNKMGESALSEIVRFETKMRNPVNPPTDLTIGKILSNKIQISWKYSLQDRELENITGFQVFYKPIDEQNYFVERITIKENDLKLNEQIHLTLVNLKKNKKYLIKVKAYNKEGYSPDSEEIECITLRGNVPSPPKISHHQVHRQSYIIVKWEHSRMLSNPTLNAALRHEELNSPNEHQQQLVPKTSVDDSNDLQDFESSIQFFMAYVEVSDLKMIVQTIPVPPNHHQVTIANLDKDVRYNIYISATNNYGESELSEPLIITIQSYQYEMNIFMAERNALIVTAVSIGSTAIICSIICSIIYIKKFQLAQQEKLRKMSTLTLSKFGTNKTTATYATIGNATIGNAPSTSTGITTTNYNQAIQHGQLTPINTGSYLENQQATTSGYEEIGLTYDLSTGGLNDHGLSSVGSKLMSNQTLHHLTNLNTFGHVTIKSDASNTQSSDNEYDIHHAIQVKDRLMQSKNSLDSMKNRINYDECIYDDALG